MITGVYLVLICDIANKTYSKKHKVGYCNPGQDGQEPHRPALQGLNVRGNLCQAVSDNLFWFLGVYWGGCFLPPPTNPIFIKAKNSAKSGSCCFQGKMSKVKTLRPSSLRIPVHTGTLPSTVLNIGNRRLSNA